MTNLIFFNETTLNDKIQVMTTLKLEGKGIKNYGGSYIVEFHNELFKDNFDYWVTKSAFEKLKLKYNLTRTCF